MDEGMGLRERRGGGTVGLGCMADRSWSGSMAGCHTQP